MTTSLKYLNRPLFCEHCNKEIQHRVFIELQCADCTNCTARQPYVLTELDAKDTYFWIQLLTTCQTCGNQIEKNSSEEIGYCWNKNCNPGNPTIRLTHRCMGCGSAKLSVYTSDSLRCNECGLAAFRKARTAC
jgi:DNA-directed RNA polymerase subunit RPC12/RpoP